jgi:hypothetical protein
VRWQEKEQRALNREGAMRAWYVMCFVPNCPGVYHVTKEERTDRPWGFKGELCRFLGYNSEGKNSYEILVVRTSKVLVRHDVIFDKNFNNALKELNLHPSNPEIWQYFDENIPNENREDVYEESIKQYNDINSDHDFLDFDDRLDTTSKRRANDENYGDCNAPRYNLRQNPIKRNTFSDDFIFTDIIDDYTLTDNIYDLEHWFNDAIYISATHDSLRILGSWRIIVGIRSIWLIRVVRSIVLL